LQVIEEVSWNSLKHKLFFRFNIDELIQEHRHGLLSLQSYHYHFNPIEQVWSKAERYYNSIITWNGPGMEAMTDMWK